jgi:hypothetical protein
MYDRLTGARLSAPRVQIFYPKEFQQMEKDNAFAGMKVTVLHDGGETVPEDQLDLNLTPQSGNISEVKSEPTKPLEDMSHEEIVKEYRRYYNEDPTPDMSDEEIKALIEERIDFIESEKQEAQANNTALNPPPANSQQQAKKPKGR